MLRRWPPDAVWPTWSSKSPAVAVLVRHRPDLVWLNTVKSACYVRPAVLLRRTVVLHVHELEPLASEILRRYRLARYWPSIRLVACSSGVAANVSRLAGVLPGTSP